MAESTITAKGQTTVPAAKVSGGQLLGRVSA